jgi:alpha-D-xyloside xylohydrolase
MEDFMNLRGKKQYLTQHNMKAMVPVLNSTAGYGLLIDCGSEMVFDDASYSADGTTLIGVEAASVMCYYFMKGHNMDATVSAYRWLSGTVPMMPLWLFGYTQSKERYVSQADLVSTLREFRNRRIPIDCIVQDWNYWKDGSWGTMSMEPSRYPDKRAMADSVHAMNARLMISIWPNMSNSPQHDEFQSRGYLLSGQNVYDAFRPEARKLYWDYAEREFFSNGFDAWWCDSSEPLDADWGNRGPNYGYDSHEERWHLQSKLLGDVLGRERGMLYSLYHSQGIYEHQRIASDKKRVVNLTRSSYAGQQRYGTIVWNGDTHASWEQFRQMIPAGLNFMATGFPYWTVDAGTFFVRKGWAWFWDGDFEQGCNDPAFREFYVRMLQYATFLPMMRSHGTDTPREPWRFGEEGTPFHDAILDCIRMRYSMLPYTYSLASRITRSDYTLTRCLAFDFPDDRKVWDIKDEFMYGPSILVAPVTTPATVPGEPNYRSVYLPKGNAWYDMTTGKRYAGGTTVSSEVPLQTIPLYVREGSILPVCGSVEYASQYTSREWTVKVYPGSDAEFEVYLDDGDGYACEEGRFATMLLKWDDNRRTLTVCKGEGRVADFVSALCLKVEVIGGGCFDVKNKAGSSIIVSK